MHDHLRPASTSAISAASASGFKPVRTLTLDVDADGIAVIRMNLPGRPMNVTTPELTSDLMSAFAHVATNAAIKGAILTSGKDKSFVAGGDIKDFVNAYDRGMTREEAFALSNESSVFFRSIETCGKPVAAAINGLALGGGLELCLACHYRVIVDDPKAIVGQPEVTIGLLPGGGGTQRLPRLIGIEAALPLLLTGRHVKPAEALRLGVVHAVVPAAELLATAKRWLLEHPDARQPWDMPGYVIPGSEGRLGPLAPHELLSSETRRNYPAPPAILSCVIDGTRMPIDDGLWLESTLFSTLLTGPVARNLMRTTFVNKGAINKLAYRPPGIPAADIARLGILGEGKAATRLARAATDAGIEAILCATADDHETGDCDLVVRVLAGASDAGKHADERPAHAQRDGRDDKDDIVGIHLEPCGTQVSLLEIVADEKTSLRAVAHAFDLAARLRKTPIALHGGSGFYSERVVNAYIDEGMRLLEEGTAPELIANAAAMAGMARGPLALAGEMRQDGEKYLQPSLQEKQELSTLQPWQPVIEETGRRLLYIQALAAARCMEEGMLHHAADADVGAVIGWGFPTYTGGPLSLIDTLGIVRFVSECEDMARRYGPRFQPSPWLAARAARGESFYEKNAGTAGA